MAYNQQYTTLAGLRAGADLSGSQFKLVKLASTAGQVVLAGTLNSTTGPSAVVGVLMNAPASGEEAEVAIEGVVKVIAGTSTIAVGDRIGSDSNSRASDAGTTDNVFYAGRALTAAGAVGDIITVLLNGGGQRY